MLDTKTGDGNMKLLSILLFSDFARKNASKDKYREISEFAQVGRDKGVRSIFINLKINTEQVIRHTKEYKLDAALEICSGLLYCARELHSQQGKTFRLIFIYKRFFNILCMKKILFSARVVRSGIGGGSKGVFFRRVRPIWLYLYTVSQQQYFPLLHRNMI